MTIAIINDVVVNPKEFTALKYAPQGLSEYPPRVRTDLPNWPDKGQLLEYVVGRITMSPSGPGIMVYPDLISVRAIWDDSWLVVTVPERAALRWGYGKSPLGDVVRIVCVSQVLVLGKIIG